MIGKTLSHFEISAKLGEGGMGEVWRGSDSRLGREVAIKVLPEAFVSEPERLGRFEREARLLASLSHPNIAAIHDVGEADGLHFLVMELAPGETLAERISRGPVPPEEALEIAGQIADAVSAAHDQGVIHRDLKPGNVMVAPDGSVKVLDFGLAKALLPEPGSGSVPELSLSPTMTFQPTAAGMLLGTAAYMSPEQAKGRPVDRRADVWAWGAILFEMLTGRQPFDGDSVADILASILRNEPDWDALPPGLPRGLEPVLRHCLEKDPKTRLRDVGDARLLLERFVDSPFAGDPTAGSRPRGRWREGLAWALAAVFLGVLLWTGLGREPAIPLSAKATRFTISLEEEAGLTMIDEPVVAMSPDGRAVAFVGTVPELQVRALYVRWLESFEPVLLSGTDGASSPFFSPDGRWIAFFAGGSLKKIPVSGGPIVELAGSAEAPRGGVWLADDSIVYSPIYSAGLWRVPGAGGAAEQILPLDPEAGERTLRWPGRWTDGRSVLFTVGSPESPNDYDDASIVLWDPASGERSVLVEGANMARVLPPDRLLYYRDNVLYLAPLDLEARATVGPGRPVVEGVLGDQSSGAAYFDVSADGSIAYAPGATNAEVARLVLVEEGGEPETLPLEPRPFHTPRISSDGSELAFGVKLDRGGAIGDVWTWSFAERALGRLTFDNSGIAPLWSPVADEIAYVTNPGRIQAKPADGTGEPRVLVDRPNSVMIPGAWSPDGRTIAFTILGSSTDLYLATEGEEPRLFETDASCPAFSPDGRWIAYTHPSSGSTTVYVRPLEGAGKWQVTEDVGGYPRWRSGAEGDRILYLGIREATRPVYAVDVDASQGLRFGSPRVVVPDTTGYSTATAPTLNYDVDPEGRRFVFVEPARGERAGTEIHVVRNWDAELGP